MKKVPVVIRGIVRWVDADAKPMVAGVNSNGNPPPRTRTLLVREAMGETLREIRQQQKRTLRDTSSQAQVALGYLSEVERAQKEASSEIIASVCEALDVPLSEFLLRVSAKVAATEPARVPDTIPAEMFDEVLASTAG